MSGEDDECSRRLSTNKITENVEKIGELIYEDLFRTIHDLTDTVEISYEVCKEILTEDLNVYHQHRQQQPLKNWLPLVCLKHYVWLCLEEIFLTYTVV